MNYQTALVWFRRDLRAHDHAAMAGALAAARRVYCVFVFDREILDALARCDRRVEFIWRSVRELDEALREYGGSLLVVHGQARAEIPALVAQLKAEAVFANEDYEPAAVLRDTVVRDVLADGSIDFVLSKDQVIFAKNEVLTKDGRPFSVFTPYKNAWLKRLGGHDLQEHAVEPAAGQLATLPGFELPSLATLGFETTNLLDIGIKPGMSGAEALVADFEHRMAHYHERRDYPARKGPSYLSVHLRFGTVSIRTLAAAAWHNAGRGAAVWLSELIWRDFYFMILHHHPRVATEAFRREYHALAFPNEPARFAAWCEARSGYPLIDAAMRQLNQTGYMHNRLRMVAASFLVKDLHIDWRWGERYFAEQLNDFDLSANNGGWQWASSTGCDSQPYFRIFNPVTQSKKFDPKGEFIRKYVPELKGCDHRWIHAPWLMNAAQQQAAGVIIGRDYPAPVVDHAAARAVTLELYKRVRGR